MQLFSNIDELRVPVLRVHVEVNTERKSHQAILFLPPGLSPREFFEEDTAFFPAEEAGKFRLFSRAAIVALVVETTELSPESLAMVGMEGQGRKIAVYLRNGKVTIGTLTSLYGRSRTLDLVNQPTKTFAVLVEGKTHHIAKHHVERIEEL